MWLVNTVPAAQNKSQILMSLIKRRMHLKPAAIQTKSRMRRRPSPGIWMVMVVLGQWRQQMPRGAQVMTARMENKIMERLVQLRAAQPLNRALMGPPQTGTDLPVPAQ